MSEMCCTRLTEI